MIWFRRPKPKTFQERVASRPADAPKITMPAPRPPGRNYPAAIQAAVENQITRTAEAIDRAVAQSLELGVGTVVITQIDGTVRASPSTLVPHMHSYHFPSEAAFRVFVLHHPKGRP